jgi:hypothetical protein
MQKRKEAKGKERSLANAVKHVVLKSNPNIWATSVIIKTLPK